MPAHHRQADDHDEGLAELLELEAEVMAPSPRDAAAWLHRLAGDLGGGRIVDLGSGPGMGTVALAQRFERTEVVAVDASSAMLGRVREKAETLGLADRVRTVRADLDKGFPDVAPIDLAWASLSLHHLADPDRVLRDLTAAVRPGGLVAVAETAAPLRLLARDIGLGQPGLEDRLSAAAARHHHRPMPELDGDWGVRLERAGVSVEQVRTFTTELVAPLPARAGLFASRTLQRMRIEARDSLSKEDTAALRTLLERDGPDHISRRDDLVIRASRIVWVGRRSASDR